MNTLAKYVHAQRGQTSALAREVGVSQGQISRVASGKSRPSPELAQRIEAATNGKVVASELLGLSETASSFDHQLAAHDLGDGRWAANIGPDGSVVLTSQMVDALGFSPGDQLVFARTAGSVTVTSTSDAIARARRMFAQRVPADMDVVSDFIADRRAEAARE